MPNTFLKSNCKLAVLVVLYYVITKNIPFGKYPQRKISEVSSETLNLYVLRVEYIQNMLVNYN